jgi:LAS superfamily LD-carboxypeptidase LdcB
MANQTEKNTIQNTVKSFFNDFNKQTIDATLGSSNTLLQKINEYYLDKLNPNSDNAYVKQKSTDDLVVDIKKTTYYNIKTIYDKVCGLKEDESKPLSENRIKNIEDLNKLNITSLRNDLKLFYNLSFSKEEGYKAEMDNNTTGSTYDLYQVFQVLDRGNNDIGTKVLADLGYLYDNLYAEFTSKPITGQLDENRTVSNLTKSSFQSIFSGLAKQSGFLFQQIPNYLNLNSLIPKTNANDIDDIVNDMFGVNTNTNVVGANYLKETRNVAFGGLFGLPGYLFQLGTTNSNLDTQNKRVKNDYTNSFSLDIGLDNNGEIVTKNENAPDEIKNSSITCFAVDFANKNQQMFTSVELDTTEFFDTEESIRTWVDVTNNVDQYLQTTNLFPVLEKRSYSCTVTSLGNATIQPLSYFYLRNVPLFHGTYWITNVSHKISPNTMMTTFKGVRQPIVSKNDVRKELLSLMRKKADALLKASDKANTVITEGLQPTSGEIKINTTNNTPYGSVIQERTDGNGYQEFDAKTLIGSYIATISGSNNTELNKAIVATLYNQSKAYSNSEDHSLIIRNIKNIVIGKIRIGAEADDKRYCDEINTPSLSKIYINSSYNSIGILSNLLDTIITASEYERLQLSDTTKIFELSATKSGSDYKFSLGNEITSIKADILPINKTTLFFDHAQPIRSDDNWAGSEVDNLILTTDNIINGLSGKTINTTIDISGIQIKYFGTYSSSPDTGKNVTFYSVNNGKIKWSDATKTKYDVSTATTDDLNQLSGDPNKDIKIFNDGDFSLKLKYPDLLSEVIKGESKDYDDYNWYAENAGGSTSRSQKKFPLFTKNLTQYTINEILNFQRIDLTTNQRRDTKPQRLFATGRFQIVTDTLNELVTKNNFDKNSTYNKETQDQLANYLVESNPNLIKYINGSVEDNEKNLNNAALAVAQIWAAVGVPYDTKGRKINVKKDQSYYTGDDNNKASISSDKIKALLKKERELFGKPNRIKQSNSGTNLTFSSGKGGERKTIENKSYDNGKMGNTLRAINNMKNYKGGIQSDDGNIRLYTTASKALDQLIKAAEDDGITNIKINSAYRTYADQVRVWGENCSNEIGTGKCIPKKGEGPAAIPGTSNHGFGLAVDFANTTNLSKLTTSDPLYIWLAENAKNYGFKRIEREAWHWEYFSLI